MSVIRQHRKARGLTQVALGALVGVSNGAISQYERGLRHPRHPIGQRLASVLECPFADLYETSGGDEHG